MCEAGTGWRSTRLALGQQLAHLGDPALDALAGAAGLLDGVGAQLVADRQLLRADDRADLVGLAAQADHEHGGEVGVAGVAAQGPAQDVHAVAFARHPAAGLVGQRHHAVDVGVVGQRVVAGEAGCGERRRRCSGRRWPSSSPRSGCRCSCAWPPGRRRARCPGRWPAAAMRLGGPGQGAELVLAARTRAAPRCGCARARPAAMSRGGEPDDLPVAQDRLSLAMARVATLWPDRDGRLDRDRPRRAGGCPGSRAHWATTTLSAGWRRTVSGGVAVDMRREYSR